jgi:hypothetical protein
LPELQTTHVKQVLQEKRQVANRLRTGAGSVDPLTATIITLYRLYADLVLSIRHGGAVLDPLWGVENQNVDGNVGES